MMQSYSVLMFDGATKMVADVEKSDVLMGPDNLPRVVTKSEICDGEAYVISPNKGKPFVLGADNYLCLSKVGAQRCLLDIHVGDFVKQSEHFQENYTLHRTGVDFKNTEEPTIDPYFLGLLLGDAHLCRVPVKLTNPEPEIINYAVEMAGSMNLTTNVCEIADANCSNIFIGSNRKRGNILRDELRKLGLWGKLSSQRFIPNSYKLGSKETRSGIIAGLLDTDGTVTDCNSVRHYTTSAKLAMDVMFVGRSLGLGCSASKPVKRNDNCTPCYTIYLYGDFSNIPIKVARKIPDPRKSPKNVLKTGLSVKRLETPSIYYKLEFEGVDQHYLKSDFMLMKGGSVYEL